MASSTFDFPLQTKIISLILRNLRKIVSTGSSHFPRAVRTFDFYAILVSLWPVFAPDLLKKFSSPKIYEQFLK